MLKCLRRILEMSGSAGLYVTTNGTTSSESLGLVCNALVREILAARRNCSSRKLLEVDSTRSSPEMSQHTLANDETFRKEQNFPYFF